jgi:hypothetical protein
MRYDVRLFSDFKFYFLFQDRSKSRIFWEDEKIGKRTSIKEDIDKIKHFI